MANKVCAHGSLTEVDTLMCFLWSYFFFSAMSKRFDAVTGSSATFLAMIDAQSNMSLALNPVYSRSSGLYNLFSETNTRVSEFSKTIQTIMGFINFDNVPILEVLLLGHILYNIYRDCSMQALLLMH